jgi:hypothetical protein
VDFGRSFIKRGQVHKMAVTAFRRSIYGVDSSTNLREFILLSDMLIYCKVGRKTLQYRGYIPTDGMLVQDKDRMFEHITTAHACMSNRDPCDMCHKHREIRSCSTCPRAIR